MNKYLEMTEVEQKGQKFLVGVRRRISISDDLIKPCNRRGCVSGHFRTQDGLVGFLLFNNASLIFFENEVTQDVQEIIKAELGDKANVKAFNFGDQLPSEGELSWKKMVEAAEGSLMLLGILQISEPAR